MCSCTFRLHDERREPADEIDAEILGEGEALDKQTKRDTHAPCPRHAGLLYSRRNDKLLALHGFEQHKWPSSISIHIRGVAVRVMTVKPSKYERAYTDYSTVRDVRFWMRRSRNHGSSQPARHSEITVQCGGKRCTLGSTGLHDGNQFWICFKHLYACS